MDRIMRQVNGDLQALVGEQACEWTLLLDPATASAKSLIQAGFQRKALALAKRLVDQDGKRNPGWCSCRSGTDSWTKVNCCHCSQE
jgi:hypothetical protein